MSIILQYCINLRLLRSNSLLNTVGMSMLQETFQILSDQQSARLFNIMLGASQLFGIYFREWLFFAQLNSFFRYVYCSLFCRAMRLLISRVKYSSKEYGCCHFAKYYILSFTIYRWLRRIFGGNMDGRFRRWICLERWSRAPVPLPPYIHDNGNCLSGRRRCWPVISMLYHLTLKSFRQCIYVFGDTRLWRHISRHVFLVL